MNKLSKFLVVAFESDLATVVTETTILVVRLILVLQLLGRSVFYTKSFYTIKHLASYLLHPRPLCIADAAKLHQDERIVKES